MKVLIASDSFKDSLDAQQICASIKEGILQAMPETEVKMFPLADGGEGTTDVLLYHYGGQLLQYQVTDPLLRAVQASFAYVADKNLAIIEMASASGIQLLNSLERKADQTTTYGTGELIAHALDKGCREIILGLGSSATNDGGIGMATALGFSFLDENGVQLSPVGANLHRIATIDDTNIHPALKDAQFKVVCDVNNPLLGPNGASKIYGPQKGADPEMVEQLEAGMEQYAMVLDAKFGPVSKVAGAGAAGGMGAASLAYLQAELKPGVDLVMELTGFEKEVEGCDLIVTGEGRIDHQTLNGKLIKGVSTAAKRHQVPVIALCGSLEADGQTILDIGLAAAYSISSGPQTLETALANTRQNLIGTSRQLFQLLNVSLNRSI